MKNILTYGLLLALCLPCFAQRPLKQSTAVTVIVGPFLDSTDASPEEALTVASFDIDAYKDDATVVSITATASGGSNDMVHVDQGYYSFELTTTDTNTLGYFRITYEIAGVLQTWEDFDIYPANIYDSLHGADVLQADLIEINSSTVTLANFDDMYNTIGYLDDTAPASRSLVDGISISTGGAIPNEALDDNVLSDIKSIPFVGVQTSGTFASTEALDGVYHQLDDTGNTIDIVYSFTISAARQAVEVSFVGRLNSGNDEINIQSYDFIGMDWETRFILEGKGGNSDDNESFQLLQKHTGTGADLGKVLIRFVGGSSDPTLFIDELLVLSGIGSGDVFNGMVWVDTANGVSGTAEGVGTSSIPSDNIADAKSIAVAHGEHEFRIITGSALTLGSNFDKFTFSGSGYSVDLNGQSVAGTVFNAATIIGNDDGSNAIPTLYNTCNMGNNTIGLHSLEGYCGLFGNITLAEAGTYNWSNVESRVAGVSTPILDLGASIGSTNHNIRHYIGGLDVRNMGQLGTDTMSFDCPAGQLILNVNCVGGSLRRAGMHRLTDNSATVTITDGFGMTIATDSSGFISGIATDGMSGDALAISALAEFATVDTGETTGVDGSVIQLAASDTWDEPTSQHNSGGTFGKAVKNLTSIILSSGTLQSSANSYSVVLDANEPTTARTYDPSRIVFMGAAPQARLIVEYSIDNASRLAILDRDLGFSVGGTTDYIILADIGRDSLNDGLLLGATSNTVTLNSLASDVDDAYIDQIVSLRAGTNTDLTGIVIAYNGTTHVATIHKPWEALPTTGTVYAVGVAGPSGLMDNAISASKYDESTAFPLTSADTGSTQIARTGADGDTLETLSDEIAAHDGKLDTVKAKTDQFVFTIANQVDANALSMSGGGDATAANQVLMMGSGFVTGTDSLEAIRNRGDAAWGGGGTGNTPVNHASGTGLELYYLDGEGAGIEAATISAFVKTEYDADIFLLRGLTTTNAAGEWNSNLMLDSGVEYTLVFIKPGAFGPDEVDFTP